MPRSGRAGRWVRIRIPCAPCIGWCASASGEHRAHTARVAGPPKRHSAARSHPGPCSG
jgi:hypothetical protein